MILTLAEAAILVLPGCFIVTHGLNRSFDLYSIGLRNTR
jgi:hypothetical protein